MSKVEIIGLARSNYTRFVRMVCEEKGIAYELIDAPPHSPPVNAIHPFGKLPVMRHDGFTAVRIKSDCNLYRPWLPGPAVNAV